jgi:hypothetical protein
MKGHHHSSSPNLLDPKHDHVAICHHLIGYDFPWEINRALELALLRTFCVPRISAILQRTGEFTHHPQKRYDDTGLILGNIIKWGYDSPQGQAAIAQMNKIHRRYAIDNADFLYVLSVMIYEPVRWNQQYGWRRFTETERQALFYFWQTVGERMHIQAIPETYEAFEAFKHTYEAENFHYSPSNAAIGEAVIALMQAWLPRVAQPIIRPLVNVMVDDPMRRALGWDAPSPAFSWTVRQFLKGRRRLLQCLPAIQRARFAIDRPSQSYPDGYQIEHLGASETTSETTSETLDAVPKASRCPFLKMQQFLKAHS